jgi:hypothetical protein
VLLIAKVESFFTLTGRGAVIVPIWLSDLRVKVGDPVQLRSPNGRVKDTRIAGVELLKPTNGECRTAFLLSREIVTPRRNWARERRYG